MTDSHTQLADDALIQDLAELMVSSLNLDMSAADINPDDKLYGDGLGLDSIDILEIALAVSKHYGFQLKADDDNNAKIFSSLRHLANHVAQHRA
jgi:acyl carrier protein